MSVIRPRRNPRSASGRPGIGNGLRVSSRSCRSYRNPCDAAPAAAPIAAPPRYLRKARREDTGYFIAASQLAELEQSARESGAGEGIETWRSHEAIAVVDAVEALEPHRGKPADDRPRIEHAMRVELEPLAAYGDAQIQASARLDDAAQFGERRGPSVGIDRIAVAAEADVLDGVETGRGWHRAGRERVQPARVPLQKR